MEKHLILIGIILFIGQHIYAQRIADVHGIDSITIGEGEKLTLNEAKQRAVEMAKIAAVKAEFGELMTSDVVDNTTVVNGEEKNVFMDILSASIRGEFLGYDKQNPKPKISVSYHNDQLTFVAEVWGQAREIVHSQTDISMEVLKGDDYIPSKDFANRDRLMIRFKSPVEGYVAVYMIDDDEKTYCLLPEKTAKNGLYRVSANQEYTFFEKHGDGKPMYLRLTTNKDLSSSQLILIFSPNPIKKCQENKGEARQVNWIDNKDFSLWLLNAQRTDQDMVVKKEYIQISKN